MTLMNKLFFMFSRRGYLVTVKDISRVEIVYWSGIRCIFDGERVDATTIICSSCSRQDLSDWKLRFGVHFSKLKEDIDEGLARQSIQVVWR